MKYLNRWGSINDSFNIDGLDWNQDWEVTFEIIKREANSFIKWV